jgi:hypothetical protein
MTRDALPHFRSPELRELAREAIRQGAHTRITGGGHYLVTNPTTGQRVSLSTTAADSRKGHTLGNARRQLERAGLVRPRHRQEVPVEVRTISTQSGGVHSPRPGAQRAGGKFARVGDVEVLEVQGHRVRLWERQDGQWVAETPWEGTARGLRAWYGPGREATMAKLQEGLDTPVEVRPHARKADAPAAAPEPEARQEEAPVPALAPVPARSYRVVQADAEEFPLVAALDGLDTTLAPALAALEAAGKRDAADLIRGELTRSPLEEEALGLYRRVMRGD